MKKVIRLFCVVILCAWSAVYADGLSDAQQGRNAQDRGDIDSAISLYTRAITSGELGSENLSITFDNRGHSWYKKGDYDRAISDYNQAISLNPQYAKAYYNRGNAWKDKGDYDRAISDFNQAISLNPQDADAYNNLSWLYATSKNAKYRDGNLAVKYGEKALALEPEAFDILDTLATAYARAGNFQKAISLQEKAIRLGKQNGKELTELKGHLMLYQSGTAYVHDE